MQVKWDELDPNLYERMVAVLIATIYPDAAEKIDGAGGDGGLDVQLRYAEERDGFELKSFTGRMTPVRRAQVKRSLRKAATRELRSWTLVVPIDPTPRERVWFDSLQALIGCPIEWRGLNWLDARMAERPFISRYFIQRLEGWVMDLLVKLKAEQAALAAGVPDAMTRVREIVEQANEIDAYYRFDIASDGSSTTTRIIPRYPGALKDRPIEVNALFKFPMTPEGEAKLAEFREAMQFGTAVTLSGEFVERLVIDAPAGLGGDASGGTVSMLPIAPTEPGRRMQLGVKNAAGQVTARVPLNMTIVSRGDGGLILEGSDRTGIFRIRMRIDARAKMIGMQLTIRGNQPYYPHEMIPVARLLDQIKAGDPLLLLNEEGGQLGVLEGEFDQADDLIGPAFTRLVEDFATLQARAGQIELVNPTLSLPDVQNIHNGARWARGESIPAKWETISSELKQDVSVDLLRKMATETFSFRLQEQDAMRVIVQGIEYRIGNMTIVNVLSARMSDRCRRQWETGVPEPGSTVTFVPGETDQVETSVR
jgi:hypothetical protein